MAEEEIKSFSFSIRNHLKAWNGYVYRDEPVREIEYEVNGNKVTKWQRILNSKWVDDDDY